MFCWVFFSFILWGLGDGDGVGVGVYVDLDGLLFCFAVFGCFALGGKGVVELDKDEARVFVSPLALVLRVTRGVLLGLF